MTQQECDQRFAKARELAENAEYSEALIELLDLIDNYRGTRNFGSPDLLMAGSEIMKIAEYAPKAKKSLEIRRNLWMEMILSGEGDWAELHDIHLINELMGQPEHDLVLLNQLSKLGLKHQEMYANFLNLAWKSLAHAGRFAELEPCIEEQTQHILCRLAREHVNWDFAMDAALRDQSSETLQLLFLDAILIYKVLLSLGKDDIAVTLARWVFDCEPLTEAPALFIATANKLGRGDVADALARMSVSRTVVPQSGNAITVSPVPISGETSQVFEGDTP